MRKMLEEWTDARLNDLAVALVPLPLKVAALTVAVEHLDDLTVRLQPLPAQVAVLTATVERLTEENRALRQELVSIQRQLLQVAWGLVAALLGAGGAFGATLL